jgi:hypothetical protein
MVHTARKDTAQAALEALETEYRRSTSAQHRDVLDDNQRPLERRRHMRRIEAIEHVKNTGRPFLTLAVKHMGRQRDF